MSRNPVGGVGGTRVLPETQISAPRRFETSDGTSSYILIGDGKVSLKDFTEYILNKESLARDYTPLALDAARELALRYKRQGKVSSSDPEQPIPEGEQIKLSVAELKTILETLGSTSDAPTGAEAIGYPRPISGGLSVDD